MRRLSQIGLGVLLVPLFIVTAQAQEIQVSGTVTSALGEKLWGVMVRVQGATARTVTDQQGHYNLSAPSDGVLTYALIGFKGATQTVGGRTTIDVTMEQSPTTLEEVIVTGYQSQRRGDITGAISSLNIESAEKQTSTSVLQRLDGQVPGVTVEAGGSPGSRTTVRIRGVSSFQNNDPLYIVDGTPVQDSYLNWLNPAEIGSMQVLKDASTASIYGSRANNGVVVIETKKGRSGGGRQIQLDVRTGVANAVKGYDSFMTLNALDYQKVVKTSYENAGLAVPKNIYGDPNAPTVPAYIWPNDGKGQSCSAPGPNCTTIVDPSTYLYPTNLIMPGSAGTNWWKAVFGSGQYRDANLAISGGGVDNSYHVSFNFLDQEGTAAYTRLQRGGVRVNTTFNVGKVNVGENVSVSRERHYGGLDDNNLGEDNIIGKNIFQQPVVPIYDVGGNFASGKATGLSNLTNPLKIAFYGKDNITNNDRIFGNVFAGIDAAKAVKLQTRFGFNLAQSAFKNYAPTTFENSEVTDKDAINENYNLFTDWTWSNTLNWTKTKSEHNLAVLLGQEANENNTRFETGSCGNLLNPSVDNRYIQDALCDPTTKNVFSSGTKAALLSFFGKADYNYGERYYLSLTVRRDGSSRFGPDNRWATFPAVGLGWRLSREGFFKNNSTFSNVMLRFGWGVTGNQQIPDGRVISTYGGDRGDTFYDIGGTNNSIKPGSKLTAIGNAQLKWEENKSGNVGLDLEFLQGRGLFTADVYQRNTNNLLFDPRTPATAGSASPPIVNIGKMKNTGIDFSIGYGTAPSARTTWHVSFNGSHYKNEIVQIDDQGTKSFFGPISLREQNPVINQIGQPIGAFYGLVADGYYKDSLDAVTCGTGKVTGESCWDDGARPGRIKFKDLNGDGHITADDRTIIGSPHPDFTGGLDLSAHHGSWDVTATVFGSFGGQIFNAQKYWTVFRYFDTNVRSDLLANSVKLDGPCAPLPAPPGGTSPGWNCPGKVTNPDALYPRIDGNDASFSRQFSSYWVESGTYVRLRTLQVAYTIPPSLVRWIPAARVYVQAENLLTFTGYSGLDPALPAWDVTGAAGDIRDQFRGVDEGSYPSNRIFTIGITTSF